MKRTSIKFQLLLIGLLLTLFATASPTFITSQLFVSRQEKENASHCIEMFQQSETMILNLLSNTHSTAFKAWSNENISNYLLEPHGSPRSETLAQYKFVQEIKEIIKSTPDLSAIIFLDDDGKLAGYSQFMRFFADSSDCSFYERLRTLEFDTQTKWLGTVYSYDLIPFDMPSPHTTNYQMICGIRKHKYFLSGSSEPQYIYILFEINSASLLHCFSHLEYEGSSVYVLDAQGQAIAGSFPVGQIPEFFSQISNGNSGSFLYQFSDRSASQVIYHKIESIGWTLVKTIPQEVYTQKFTAMWQNAIIVGVITFILALIFYSVWTKRILIPISKLTSSIRQLKEGRFDARVTLQSNYPSEMYLVCEQFNELLDNLNMLLLQKELDDRERVALEIKTLQAQITPHFIYNSLTAIRYMAFASGAANVEEALVTFSNIIRPIFSTWQSSWQLREELEFIDHYIYLIHLRYGNRITFVIEKDAQADVCLIPRFCLQTLLENCCEHGYAGDENLHVHLKTQMTGETLTILVKDNGVGIPEEKLTSIRENIKRGTCENSIGLTNLDRRIKLFSGNEYGLDIQSTYEKGTEIIVRMRVSQT